ncbi:uncharacterized protein V6R79_010122 [Siganus canaliculatus]
MAPALTKILRDGHGIHLSSPSASVRMDPDRRATHSTELESPMRRTDDDELQKMWLNLPSFPSLDSCLSLNNLDVPSDPLFSPCPQSSASQCKMVLLPSPTSHSLELLSFSEDLRDSHQEASVFPGVPDMFLVPVPEHNSQETCLQHGSNAQLGCGPDGGDVRLLPPTFATAHLSYSQEKIKHQVYSPVFARPPTLTQENVTRVWLEPPPSLAQPSSGTVNSEQLESRLVLDDVLKEQLSRQAGLHCRAQRLRRRLQALLGDHASLHCQQQLEGLKRCCQLGSATPDSLDFLHPGILPPQVGYKSHFLTGPSSLRELSEFSCSSQAVLRSLQEALDSEATASSSSDEELEEDKIVCKKKNLHVGGISDRQWLEVRAELGSRWSWLQLRLSALEGRIQQLVELHRHIRSTKGGVVLADSQPLTDRQIQQTLLREMAGLSCTASDADTEPCSPTRLLHNIEKQSAQLSQIVNSLMPPLSFSPLSKQPNTWTHKRAFTSGRTGDDTFVPGTSKRRRLGTRRLFKADVSCVCARTRPVLSYHKPRLFAFSTCRSSSSSSSQSVSAFSSSLSSSSCSCCSSCDPDVLCSDPDCSSSGALRSSRTPNSTPRSLLSLSSDTPLSQLLKTRGEGREEWSQRPLVNSVGPSSPAQYNSSTPLHNSHKLYKRHRRHRESRVMGLSPIVTDGCAQRQHRGTSRKKRKRRRIHRLMEDEEDVLYQLCDTEDSSDEVLEQSYAGATHTQVSQGFIRKRQGLSVYNINNIVIPMSVTKVEKLQYKDVQTPSWRMVDTSCCINTGAENVKDQEEGQVEDLSDEVFTQRHLALEQREKLRWGSWGTRKCFRRPKRSGCRLTGTGGWMCTSGEESSVELSCVQLDTDEQQSSEEWQPLIPWERRVFPLDQDDENALLSDNPDKNSSECSSGLNTSKNFLQPSLQPVEPCGAPLLPAGHCQSSTADGS